MWGLGFRVEGLYNLYMVRVGSFVRVLRGFPLSLLTYKICIYLGLRVRDLGFRVRGLGFTVWGFRLPEY